MRRRPCRGAGALGRVLLLLVGLSLGCGHEPPWPGTPGDRVVVLVPSSIGPLDPRRIRDSTTGKVSRLVHRGLFRVRGEDLAAEPDLAEGLVEEGALRRCLRLRSGLRFHDGRALRAGDVAWTIRSTMAPGSRSPVGGLYRDRFEGIDLPDGPDGLRVCFDLRDRIATFRTDLVLGIVPEGTPMGSLDAPGLGPYRVRRRDGDRTVILERVTPRPGYPGFLVFRNLPDENTRLLALLAGDADLVLNGFSPSVVGMLGGSKQLRVARHPSVSVTYLSMNTTRRGLADRRVRLAIALALDRPWIARERFGGAARIANGMLPEGHWARSDSVAPIAYDPGRARALLDAAGFAPDEQGVRLRLELLTSNDRLRRLVGRDVVRMLRAVGIDVRLRSLELGTFFESLRGGRYALAILQLPEPIEPDMMRWMFYSLATPIPRAPGAVTARGRAPRRHLEPGLGALVLDGDAEPICRLWALERLAKGLWTTALERLLALPRQGGGNRSFWADPRLDCWLDRARRVETPSARRALYAKIQGRLSADVPVLFLWHEDNVAVYRAGLLGVHLGLRPDLSFVPDLRKSEAGTKREAQASTKSSP